jgi:hypothetical protein
MLSNVSGHARTASPVEVMENSAGNNGGAVANGAAGSDQDNGAGEQPERRRQGRMDRIARRAHEIYERRGGEHGKAVEDWLQAEREIDAESEG